MENIESELPMEELPEDEKQMIMDEMMDEIDETLARSANNTKKSKPKRKFARGPIRPISVCDVGKSPHLKDDLPKRPITSFNELHSGQFMTTNPRSFGISKPDDDEDDEGESIPLNKADVPRFLTGEQLGGFHGLKTYQRFGQVPHWRKALERPSSAPAPLVTSELARQSTNWFRLYNELYKVTV